MATIKEIAEQAGVSRRTVDRVINNRGSVKPETEERIRKLIEESNYQPNRAGRALAAGKRKIKIGFCSIKGKNAVLHEEIRRGALEKARDLQQFGVNVEFYTMDRDHPMSEEEISRMAEEFDCDGLAVIPNQERGVDALIHRAEEMGIPMVFYNADNDSVNRCCYVGCDYHKAGRMAAGLAALCSGGKAKVGIFTVHFTNHPSYQDRVAGFKEEMEARFREMEIVGSYLLKDDSGGYYDTVRRAAAEHPEMNVIYLVNPGDYSVCRTVRQAAGERRIQVITNDLTDEVKPLLKEGLVAATISQDPESQGRLPLELLFNKLVMGMEPEQEIYYTDLNIYIMQSLYPD